MNKKFLIAWALLLTAVSGVSLRYLLGPGEVPEGQPKLGGVSGFRALFDANVDKARVVAYLNPTDRKDLLCAALLDARLAVFERSPLAFYVVWSEAPGSDVLARVPSKQAAQFADSGAALRKSLGDGQVLMYARGANLAAPALRTKDVEADIRSLLTLLHEHAPVPKVVTTSSTGTGLPDPAPTR
jgi:hypothetical protein